MKNWNDMKAVVMAGLMGAAMQLSAGTPSENVQTALDKLYPGAGWTVTRMGDSNVAEAPSGLRDGGVIATHPLSKTEPAVLTRMMTITGAYPVLHVRVAAAPFIDAADWLLRVRVNGVMIGESITVSSKTARDYRFPLAYWADRGEVKVELENAAGGKRDWDWELALWHLIEIVEDKSVYAAGNRWGAFTCRPRAMHSLKGPSMKDIKLGGHVGEALDRHIANGMAKKDADAYAAVFSRGKLGKLGPWAGEYWGKWLLSAAPALTYSGNAELKAKIDRTVNYVFANQYADGYIGDIPENRRFIRTDWDIWCRKYTSLGLLAYYRETGDARALGMVRRLCDNLMGVIGPGKLDIAQTGTHHAFASMGILQVFVRLATLTGEKKYRDYAFYIADQMERGPEAVQLVSRALVGKDIGFYTPYVRPFLWENSCKSYEMTTCYLGLLDFFRAGGPAEYGEAALRAGDSIARTEIMIIGAANTREQWCGGATRQTLPFAHPNEGCTKAMWMHLCRDLLETTGDARWADEFERALFNGFLAGLSPDGSRFQMYQALFGRRGDGARRNQCGLKTHCCNEICPLGFIDLLNSVVMTDGKAAYVAQYIPGRVTVELEGAGRVEIVQTTDYPKTGKIRLTVNPEKPARFALNVRRPGWCSSGGKADWKQYVRDWKRGDTLDVEWPIRVVAHRQNGHVAFTAGPIALSRDTRYADGDIDEPIEFFDRSNTRQKPTRFRVDNKPHPGRWISYVAEGMGHWDGLGGYDGVPGVRRIRFCDYASAANTWDDTSRCRVWCPEVHERPKD